MIYSGLIRSCGTGVQGHGPYIKRLHLEIGDNRLNHVLISNYLDDFIRPGETISISGYKSGASFGIAAIKRQDGEVIKSPLVMPTGGVSSVIAGCGCMPLIAFVAAIYIAGLLHINYLSSLIVLLLPLYVTYRLVVKPWRLYREARKAFD